MITVELLTLNLPYLEIRKSWQITQAVIDGVLPKLPPLASEYDDIIKLYKECVAFTPEDRPTASDLVSKIQTLKGSAGPGTLKNSSGLGKTGIGEFCSKTSKQKMIKKI